MKSNKIQNINTKVLLRFLLVFVVIFALMWMLQILLYDQIYKNVKTREVKRVSGEAVKNFNPQNMDGLFDLSFKTECNIIVFDELMRVIFTSSRTQEPQPIRIHEMLEKLGDQKSVGYEEMGTDELETYVVVVKINIETETYYIYVNGIITPIGSTVQVIMFLLLIVSLASLVIASIVSVYLSTSLSKPIKEISNKAKQLSDGNFDVYFDSRDYEEVSQLSDTLNYAVAEMKKGHGLQREVLQNVSHELRTPLTVIQSYAELINDYSGKDPKKRKEHIDIILFESRRLAGLVNDIMELSKMKSKTMEYDMTTFNLSDSLAKLEKHYKHEYEKQGYQLSFLYTKECMITADVRRIEQVLINLINNAINYSIDKKKIAIKLFEQDDKYRFEVTDTGMGISKEDIDHIFEKHFRSVRATRVVAGSGVGLTIAKEILDHHNFEYGVDSELGKGSTFYVIFKKSE